MRFAEDRHRSPGDWVQFTNVLDVVGVVHRLTDGQAFARAAQIAERRRLMYGVNLQFEPNNPHDRNAIAVIGAADCPGLFGVKAKEWKIGYLPREVAADVVSELIEPSLAVSVELYSIYRTDRYLEIRIIVLAPPGHSHSARMKRKSGGRSRAPGPDSAH